MNATRLIAGTLFWIIAAIGLVLILFVAQCTYVSGKYDEGAKQRMQAFCARFPPGASMDEARKAAATEGDGDARALERDRIEVGILTGPMFMRRCRIEGRDGRVVKATYETLE